jgi:hypothetical protein
MKNGLMISNGKPVTAELQRQEKRVRDADRNYAEAWVAVGDAIRDLYVGGEWKKSGFTNFDKYMDERGVKELSCAKSHAQRLMASAGVRHLLPDLSSPIDGGPQVWPITVVTQFTRQFRNPKTNETVTLRPSTISKLGEKCAKLAEKGEAITVAVVKPMVDAALGVTRIANEKKGEEVAMAPLPHEALETLRRDLAGTLRGFKSNPAMVTEAWQDSPETVKRLIRELESLARFLKECE